MSTKPPTPVIDFDRLAADFDRFLPFIQPVTAALLERLPALPNGACVLDVACGTGEPGLTLARQRPGVQLLSVDPANGMIQVARSKAPQGLVANVSFEVAAAEKLPREDGSVDAVVSRFGLLMVGDVLASAHELARVLRPGGRFSVAVWDSVALNTFVDVVMSNLRPHLSASQWAFTEHLDQLAAPGYREDLLRGVGLQEVRSEPFSWHYHISGLTELMALITGPGMFSEYFASLSEALKEQVSTKTADKF